MFTIDLAGASAIVESPITVAEGVSMGFSGLTLANGSTADGGAIENLGILSFVKWATVPSQTTGQPHPVTRSTLS